MSNLLSLVTVKNNLERFQGSPAAQNCKKIDLENYKKVRPVRLNEMPKKTLKEIGIIGIIGLRRKE